MADIPVLPSAQSLIYGSKNGEKEKGREVIEQKDFFWDQLLVYIGTAILGLTLLVLTVEFLRGQRGVVCFTPYEDGNFTRDQSAYVNSFCVQSVPSSEYFPVFIIVQGLLLLAPQYLWEALFRGYFSSFFELVQELDRLRDSNTGEYSEKNVKIVIKLEDQFSSRKRGIFAFYITKLGLQFLIAVGSLGLSEGLFQDFSPTFTCPEDGLPPDWPLSFNVTCAFPSLKLLSFIQFFDYVFVVLAILVTLFGIIWCITRHTTELGHRKIALFAFTSGLTPESFIFPSLLRCKYRGLKERLILLFSPRIKTDMDFLLMRLFRADAGVGQVFKDVQVYMKLKYYIDQDHKFLNLFIEAQQDEEYIKQQREEQCPLSPVPTSLDKWDVRDYFWGSGYDTETEPGYFVQRLQENPEEKEGFKQRFSQRLGNVKWSDVHHPSIRNRLYAFVSLTPQNKMALDISFGSTGYVLELTRAFKQVIAINFHPHYRNEKQVCAKEDFNTNFCTLRVWEDMFTQKAASVRKFIELLFEEFRGQPGAWQNYIKDKWQLNFVVVGPIIDRAQRLTANIMLEKLHNASCIAKDAILLAVRPLRIEHEDVSTVFHGYKPQRALFSHSYHAQKIQPQLVKLEGDLKLKQVGESEGIPVTCGNTYCVFEFITYRYKREGLLQEDDLEASFFPPHSEDDTWVNMENHES